MQDLEVQVQDTETVRPILTVLMLKVQQVQLLQEQETEEAALRQVLQEVKVTTQQTVQFQLLQEKLGHYTQIKMVVTVLQAVLTPQAVAAVLIKTVQVV